MKYDASYENSNLSCYTFAHDLLILREINMLLEAHTHPSKDVCSLMHLRKSANFI